MFESLESRVLMSVTVDDGVLKITGTRNNDTYTITQSGTTLTINSSVDGRRRFRGIDKIVIRGRDGNDLVRASRSRTRMEIYGGSGADELIGGLLTDKIYGGPGGDEINGLGGNDRIEGGKGSDDLIGGSGEDKVLGGTGRDFLDRDDEDTLKGGPGKDSIVNLSD